MTWVFIYVSWRRLKGRCVELGHGGTRVPLKIKDFSGGVRIDFVHKDGGSMRLQEGFLPSDGSGIDPHATLLVVQPVTQTGQRDRRDGRVGSVGGARLS